MLPILKRQNRLFFNANRMKSLTFAAIQRYSIFSPNHVGNDAAIFNDVAAFLVENGHKINFYSEQNFLTDSISENHVFTMLRSKAAIRKLQRLEDEMGVIAVNSGHGIENCCRETMTNLLINHGIPHPDSVILDSTDFTAAASLSDDYDACWIKRADFHAVHKEDVTFVRNRQELCDIMAEYALRGIERVVINKHLQGDLVKFYGVTGTDFFYWFYPQAGSHSKFGLESINGAPQGISFSEADLRTICNDSARLLKVNVYGGDCIVSPDGIIRIIDFNDWPSFAPCRQEAAKAIGQTILKEISQR